MSFKLKLSSQNQITLPGRLLERLGIHSGQYIEIVEENGRFVVRTFREVLEDLDKLTIGLQKKTKALQSRDSNWNVDEIVDESTKTYYQSQL